MSEVEDVNEVVSPLVDDLRHERDNLKLFALQVYQFRKYESEGWKQHADLLGERIDTELARIFPEGYAPVAAALHVSPEAASEAVRLLHERYGATGDEASQAAAAWLSSYRSKDATLARSSYSIFSCCPLPWRVKGVSPVAKKHESTGYDYVVLDSDGDEIALSKVMIRSFAEDIVDLVNRYGSNNDIDYDDDSDETFLADDDIFQPDGSNSLKDNSDAKGNASSQTVRSDQEGQNEGRDVKGSSGESCCEDRSGEHGEIVGNRKEAKAQDEVNLMYHDEILIVALAVLFTQRCSLPFTYCVDLAHSVFETLYQVGTYHAEQLGRSFAGVDFANNSFYELGAPSNMVRSTSLGAAARNAARTCSSSAWWTGAKDSK